MEFKFRANIVKSKELTIEANDLNEAMEKAKAMFNEAAKGLVPDILCV